MSLASMSQALKTSNKSVTQPQAVTPPSAGVSGAAPKAAPQLQRLQQERLRRKRRSYLHLK